MKGRGPYRGSVEIQTAAHGAVRRRRPFLGTITGCGSAMVRSSTARIFDGRDYGIQSDVQLRSRRKRGGPEEPPALTFANLPQKHACIDCDRGYRLTCIINKLR